jgi:uncharacterized protein (DUF924 family)
MLTPEDIVNFWYYELSPSRWFAEDPALDLQIRDKFLDTYELAVSNKLAAWEDTPEGVLALLLVLDQFPRRMFRGTPRAYETDETAIDLARRAIIKHFDDRIDRHFKLLFYLPFLNSESVGDQRLALFYIRERTKEDMWLTLAEQHMDVVQRFGRFPHRNPVLGRETTPEENEYLKTHKIIGD